MSHRVSRRGFLVVGTAALAGCTSLGSRITDRPTRSPDPAGTTSPTDTDSPESEPTTGSNAGSSAGSRPPTADHTLPLPMDADDLRDQVVSGGPPKDGIPSIDQPSFVSAGEAQLADNDIVFGIATDDVAKAYPQNILVWHEICNDVIDGVPLSVTYCPLTGTAIGFERGKTSFGVSGRLVNNNLIMYDRGTERWWPQVLATSIPGPWNPDSTAHSLRERRLVWTTWDRWKTTHPETKVLSRDTGFARNYDGDPYGSYDHPDRSGYYSPKSSPMFKSLSPNDSYPPKSVFIGARSPDGAVAFRKSSLLEQRLMDGELGETPVLAVHDKRLDTGYVYLNPEGRSYEVDGETVVGPDGTTHQPDDLDLDRVHAFDAMWFAWSGFYPNTAVYD